MPCGGVVDWEREKCSSKALVYPRRRNYVCSARRHTEKPGGGGEYETSKRNIIVGDKSRNSL
jgi:hypothetical protein